MSECNAYIVNVQAFCLIAFAIFYILWTINHVHPYGKYATQSQSNIYIPAKIAWVAMELPSFLVPVLLVRQAGSLDGMGSKFLTFMFCGHYFHRTFIYAVRNNGCPTPLRIVLSGSLFCTLNGYLQGHNMIYCTQYDDNWITGFRFISGIMLYFVGMSINIHSDCILIGLRKPGDFGYYIPQGTPIMLLGREFQAFHPAAKDWQYISKSSWCVIWKGTIGVRAPTMCALLLQGGLFEYVTAANYFGEIVEWFGYAIATSTLPAFAFAIFSACNLGTRAWHHHRYYLEKFDDYPKSRKVLVPHIF